MKKLMLLFIVLWSLTMQQTSAQEMTNSWDSLTAWIEQQIHALKPDLRGKNGYLELEFRKGESSNLLIANKAEYMSTRADLTPLFGTVPKFLYNDQDSLHLRAFYQFDEYSEGLYFTSWENVFTRQNIFGGYYLVDAESPGGMGRFLKSWAAYVQQLVPVDTTTRYTRIGEIQWPSFDVDLDGQLIPNASDVLDSILSTFLKNERNWKPRINYGRPVRVRVALAFPERISHLYQTHWGYDMFGDPVIEEYAHNLHHQYIFVADNIHPLREGINVISMRNDRGKIAAVRYHKGDLEACKELEKHIRNSNTIKDYFPDVRASLRRIYFYTYQE